MQRERITTRSLLYERLYAPTQVAPGAAMPVFGSFTVTHWLRRLRLGYSGRNFLLSAEIFLFLQCSGLSSARW
jgi:hypothetical protein